MLTATGLEPLTQYRQFIIWERQPQRVVDGRSWRVADLRRLGWPDDAISALPAGEKTDKVPVDPSTLLPRSAHDPAIQTDYNTALHTATVLGEPYGVGFAFRDDDPFFFVDVDNCADPDSPNGWSPRANELMSRLSGAAVEISQSGRGLHIIGICGQLPPRDCKYKDEFDLYTEGRFVALTGAGVVGDVLTDHTGALTAIVHQYLTPTVREAVAMDAGPVPEWDGYTDDDQLIERALHSGGALSSITGRAIFKDLWERNVPALARSYPDDQGLKEYDESKADMALAQHLAFWTGKDGERIRRIMLRSGLAREKWSARADYYLPRTIERACSMQVEVHKLNRAPESTENIPADSVPLNTAVTTGFQYMSVPQQLEHFAGCVYVMDQDRVLTPTGDMLKQSQFRVMYGGYIFALDGQSKKTTKNAWECFTESQAIKHPKVHELSFKPMDAPGAVSVDSFGRVKVNSFTPRYGERRAGDVTPFLNHIARLLPDVRDQEILLSYLAACVQYPGTKFQWCVVLQGVQGNGKTAITKPLVHALGEKYVFQLNANDADNKFNSWVDRHLLVCVEEIRVAGRHDLVDALKPLITNDRIPIQAKGKDQRTGDNCANFVMFSNHKDAVFKTVDDRRYCVFYTAQQSVDDLHRDGMDAAYFAELYGFLRSPEGAAAVTHYLATRPVCVNVLDRAPETTTTRQAYVESLGPAEQILIEAIELDKFGFRGGLMSTTTAETELSLHGRRMSPNAVARVLRNIGYIPHPELGDGRVSVNGARVRLYARQGHEVCAMKNRDEIAAYWMRLNV